MPPHMRVHGDQCNAITLHCDECNNKNKNNKKKPVRDNAPNAQRGLPSITMMKDGRPTLFEPTIGTT